MELSIKERRSAQRVPCDMYVAYKVLRRGMEACEDDHFVRARTRDISEFGLGMLVNEEFAEGDMIRVDFTLGGRKLESVCEIMWCNEIFLGEDHPQYAIGIGFTCLRNEDQQFLETYFRMRFESIWDFLMNPER